MIGIYTLLGIYGVDVNWSDIAMERGSMPIAIHIKSYPWLKALVRIILYPVVGLAWLFLSTTAFAKKVIVVCLQIGCAGIIRFR